MQPDDRQIKTERLRLRPYAPEDLDTLHRLWTHPDVRRFLCDDRVVARDWVEAEIAISIASFEADGFGQWAMLPKGGSGIIGFCGFRTFDEPPGPQLLYGLLPAFWGQGLATEAARAAIRYAFEEAGFAEVVAAADAPNLASLRVMQKAGMSFQRRVAVDGAELVYYSIRRVVSQFERG